MGFAALVSSFALMAASPQAPPLLLAQADAPVSRNTDSNIQASAEALARGEEPFPPGAPTDDYGFLSWCYGALSGHVALYLKVLPEVRRIETAFPSPDQPVEKAMADYESQHIRGERLLASYSKALDAHKPGKVTRAAGIARGQSVWKGSDTAEPRQLAQLWMSWGLPGRCQVTARKLGAAVP